MITASKDMSREQVGQESDLELGRVMSTSRLSHVYRFESFCRLFASLLLKLFLIRVGYFDIAEISKQGFYALDFLDTCL